MLLPLKDAWRDARFLTPPNFASQSLFERAFRELLFCKTICVITDVGGQALLSLPAVCKCTSLRIFRPPSGPSWTLADMLAWLYVDAYSKEPKWLDIAHYALGDSFEHIVQQLKAVSVRLGKDRLQDSLGLTRFAWSWPSRDTKKPKKRRPPAKKPSTFSQSWDATCHDYVKK